MRAAYPAGEVRQAERALMALVPEGALMRRAAAGLAATCAGLLGRVYGSRVAVLAGTGDNGGDALFAGARLAGRGARVTAVAAGDRVHQAGAAALARAGGRLARPGDPGAADAVSGAGLVIDGILGIGGRGGLREPAATLARLAERARSRGALVVAADLPSGVDADTGVTAGPAIRADVTVTFGVVKPGLLIDPGAGHAGVVELVDIGLGPHLPGQPAVIALQSADAAASLPVPGAESDKYRRGVLGVLAGSARFTGAAALCAGGAVRGGAGMVRLVSARPAAEVVRQRWPEAVVTVAEDAGGPGQAIAAAGRVQAWAAGPGLGTGDDAAEALGRVLATALPVVVDADGLGRLLNEDPGWIEAHRLEAARRAAARLRVTVLLKGSTTVVAPPDAGQPALVNPTGTPWLATAGSGDVLTGLAGALLAQGARPAATAAAAAAYLHGLAGRLAAREAPAGASDVLAALPEAFRQVRAALPGPAAGQAAGAGPSARARRPQGG